MMPAADMAAHPPAAPARMQVGDIPWDSLFPQTTEYRRAIVSFALPHLLTLLQDPTSRAGRPRDMVNKALDQCRAANDWFWGSNQVFSRKRTVVDSILAHYFTPLERFVAKGSDRGV